MKVLISSDSPSAHYFIRLGMARVFAAMGFDVTMWDINQKSVYDAFDEFQPDLFIGQTYNINRSLINVIKERPWIKVIMKAGDWGPQTNEITDEFQVLKASETEKRNTLFMKQETGKPDYVYIHYPEYAVEATHGYWIKEGVPVYSNMCAADVFDYTNGKPKPEFACDIAFVGGYWPYKAQIFDKYLIPLCDEQKYNIKIFGNGIWPVPQYCGLIDNENVKHLLASAKICPALHEPHSQKYGFDVSERVFKILANKCFCISDNVEALRHIFKEGEDIIIAKNKGDFIDLVYKYLNDDDQKKIFINNGYNNIINNHTYFHRVRDILVRLNLVDQANLCEKTYENVKEKMKL